MHDPILRMPRFHARTRRMIGGAFSAALAAQLATTTFAQTPPTAAPATQAAPRKKLRYTPTQPTVFPGATVAFPKLEGFVQGEPRDAWVPGKVMVFEFFSTSCGHCAEAAPMVDEFVRKYTPLGWEFIGVTSDDEAAVREFLADPAHRALYSYSIAVDPDRSAQEVLQNGTLQNLSPRMFVVRDGVLLWCGHPEIAAEPLSAIAAGTWDTAAAKPKFVLDAIVARAKKQAGTRTTEAEKTGDWQPVLDFLDAVAAAIPERASTFELQKFGVLVGPADNPVEGYALGKQLALRDAKDIVTLRTLARTVLNAPEVRLRDLDFAFAVARAADNIGKGEDARANELLALAYFSRGDREKAIAHQTKAIALQTNPKLKRTYETQLSKYRTAEPKPVAYTPKAGGAATKPDPNASGDGADAAH